MPFLLDTDHLSILHRRQQPECDRIITRLSQYPADDISVSIISFHEIVKGWMAYLNQSRTSAKTVRAYAELEIIWRSFCKMNLVSYSIEAEHHFTNLRKQGIRIGTMDLRIASIGLETNAIVVSRNGIDFGKIQGLITEDWTSDNFDIEVNDS